MVNKRTRISGLMFYTTTDKLTPPESCGKGSLYHKASGKFFIDVRNLSDTARQFKRLESGEGLVILRAKSTLITQDIIDLVLVKLKKKLSETPEHRGRAAIRSYTVKQRPDIDASPICVELIIFKE